MGIFDRIFHKNTQQPQVASSNSGGMPPASVPIEQPTNPSISTESPVTQPTVETAPATPEIPKQELTPLSPTSTSAPQENKPAA